MVSAPAGSGSSGPPLLVGRSDDPWPRATSLLAAVIGDPIRHSLSPSLLNAAFRVAGLDWVYVAFEVRSGDAGAAVMAARTLGIAGMSVTMPHKTAIVGALDGCSATAAKLGAVNTVVRRGSALLGESTDGEGFINALRESAAMDPAGRDCIVLGTGGAARAVVLALAEHGARSVGVVGRRAEAVAAAASLAGTAGRAATSGEASSADLVVNATPVGMSGTSVARTGAPVGSDTGPGSARSGPGSGDLLVASEDLGPGQVVMDLVYEPRTTPLLETARMRGALAVGGVGMLVHQAALAFKLWTGEEAPLAAMWDAVAGDREAG